MQKGGYAYILTDRAHGVLYTGVTAAIDRRIHHHRTGDGSRFTR